MSRYVYNIKLIATIQIVYANVHFVENIALNLVTILTCLQLKCKLVFYKMAAVTLGLVKLKLTPCHVVLDL